MITEHIKEIDVGEFTCARVILADTSLDNYRFTKLERAYKCKIRGVKSVVVVGTVSGTSSAVSFTTKELGSIVFS